MHPERIGRYRVVRRIGHGGMGVVYEGHDDRLDRSVAIKVIRPELFADPSAQDRFAREARAAARVNHPNICALYEFDEENGQPYLVMELLTGEPLSARLERGALPAADVFRLSDQILDALSALHRSGVIHRDLKPANIHLTPHGAKLMDFGLAQPVSTDALTHLDLTGAGGVAGTPQYMSPERLFGQPADERADVWAAAAVIYELASGASAFRGATFASIVHAIGYDEPAPLEDRLYALDSALRAGLAKDPARRTASAAELAAQIRAAAASTGEKTNSRPITNRSLAAAASLSSTRFVALPLRVLRSDPETDFLAFSVPDAVSAALASLESVIVRAPRALPDGAVDARSIGREWAVDVVLTGTLMRAGSTVRVSAQLIDAADGTLRWSETAQAPLTDLFQLQDALTTRIVSSLQLPLSGRDRRALARQAPANPEAYALYMRGNQMMTDSAQWPAACDLYERAVALDPSYAPAWAGLGRARRVLAKWSGATGSDHLALAQAALGKALLLDPDLSSAHDLAASVDVELGLAPEAMARLLERAASRPRDAGVMTGLVIACRYAGLLGPSLAAHERAIAIDSSARTSVGWTHYHLADYAAAIAAETGTLPYCAVLSRIATGDLQPAELRRIEESLSGRFQLVMRVYLLIVEGRVTDAVAAFRKLAASGFNDPEAWFLVAGSCARAGAGAEALTMLEKAIDAGFACDRQLTEHDHWRRLQHTPGFEGLLERTREMMNRALALYDRAGGNRALGPADN